MSDRRYGSPMSQEILRRAQALENERAEKLKSGEIRLEAVRVFDTGATRSSDEGKHDFEGYLSPLVLERFAQYMTSHRKQPDGKLRASDNWQKGIPRDQYIKSAWRHFFDVWKAHRGHPIEYGLEESLCAVLFNISGFLHELLKERLTPPSQGGTLKP